MRSGRAETVSRQAGRVERAFLPAALEIVETPASPTLRITAALIVLFLTTSALAVADLTAAASLNAFDPSLQSAVTTAEDHANACAASANATGTKLQSDLSQFIADASA